RGDDLPAKAEPVDEPPARLRLAPTLEEGGPVAVELRLVLAEHDHRDGVVELVVRSRRHGLERLAEEREVHHLDRAGWPAGRFALHGSHTVDPGIRKDRRVELRRLLGFLRVPEKRKDLRARI